MGILRISIADIKVFNVPDLWFLLRVCPFFSDIGKIDTAPGGKVLRKVQNGISFRFCCYIQCIFQFNIRHTRVVLRGTHLTGIADKHWHLDPCFLREKLTKLHTGRNIEKDIIGPVSFTYPGLQRTKSNRRFTS
ncbi:hypothetical protein D3C85_869850 [compost metagenome]